MPSFATSCPASRRGQHSRLCVAGDTSGYHGGCDAVMRTLWRLAVAKGWQVVPEGADHDALLVNGEGNMHHGSKRFHHKMRLLTPPSPPAARRTS